MTDISTTHRSGSRPVRIFLGVVFLLVGALVFASPVISRTTLIVAMVVGSLLVGSTTLLTAQSRMQRVNGYIWLAVGLVIVVWPDRPLTVVALAIGGGLLASGVVAFWPEVQSRPRRWPSLLISLALAIAGMGVMIGARTTILLASVVFGLFLIIRGIQLLTHAHGDVSVHHSRIPSWLRIVGAGVVTAVAVALLIGSTMWRTGIPEADAFYDAPDNLPAEPGMLLKAEPYTTDIPDNAKAWRILYTTTRDDDTPAVSSGIVVVPTASSSDPIPVITWAHGTTGYATGCAPSVLSGSFETGAMFVLKNVIDQGWAMVSSDYVGLGTDGPHPYLIGDQEARSVLDATRAARQMSEISLSNDTVVWGHSQGGHAALWSGQLADTYAPDAGVIGVAALAPASDLPGLVNNLQNMTGGSIFGAYVIRAYSEIYSDVEFNTVVNPRSEVLMMEMSNRCLAEKSLVLSVGSALVLGKDVWNQNPMDTVLGTRLKENVPLGTISVPVFIGQGLADSLILPATQEEYVKQRCAMGTLVEFHTYEGRNHVPLVEADSPLIPDLMQWTSDRFAGTEPVGNCS